MRKLAMLLAGLVLVLGLVSAVSVASAAKIGHGSDPAIYEHTVVFADDKGQIHLYDLEAKKKADKKVAWSMNVSVPDISEGRAVWKEQHGEAFWLIIYDLKSGTNTAVKENIDNTSVFRISGSRVVWSAGENVYMRDVSVAEPETVRVARGESPDIDGEKITFLREEEMKDVYYYDLKKRSEVLVEEHGHNYDPHISGNRIIWSDFNTREGYVRMYDIKTKRIIDITPDTGGVRIKGKDYDTGADTGRYPDISGNYIVYWKTMDDPQIRVHGRGGEYAGIYAYDIASRTHGLVVRLPSGNSEEEKRPVVYASGRTMTVIWRNNGILCAGKIWI